MTPAYDEEAKSYAYRRGFLRPNKGIYNRNDEGEYSPNEPGQIEETFDHLIAISFVDFPQPMDHYWPGLEGTWASF
jgi:hypothetical protein